MKKRFCLPRHGLTPIALVWTITPAICLTACSAQPSIDPALPELGNAMPKAGSVEIPRGGKDRPLGYYRMPAIHEDTIVFTSEGDLWTVTSTGGIARRMTSHHGMEQDAVISPDGSTVAFRAQYQGGNELYTMPIDGGLPTQHTFDGWTSTPVGYTNSGSILFSTSLYSTIPNRQLVALDPTTRKVDRIPIEQAVDGVFSNAGETIFFARLGQGSNTKRYKGGTAHQLWKYDGSNTANEAVYLTADYPGTNNHPMWWNGRVYFATDRDDTMNIWSMNEDGGDLQQHTHHIGWEVKGPALHNGRIVYQYGADLRLFDIQTNADSMIPITLETDFDQMREKWISNPFSYLNDFNISPEGDKVVMTARGEIFVAPHKDGRITHVTRQPGVRYRQASYMPDSDELIVLSDESGEVELWTMADDGSGEHTQLTNDADILRWNALPSPNGKWIAHTDKNYKLWLYDVEAKTNTEIDKAPGWNIGGLAWSPDSHWLAYTWPMNNGYSQIRVYDLDEETHTGLTTDRFNAYAPAWGPDGKWLYFASDRVFRSSVRSPWGVWQPEPVFDKTTRLYALALQDELRSPFASENELTRAAAKAKAKAEEDKKKKKTEDKDEPKEEEKTEESPEEDKEDAEEDESGEGDEDDGDEPGDGDQEGDGDESDDEGVDKADDDDAEGDDEVDKKTVLIELDGIQSRIHDVPVGPGNYGGLFVAGGALYFTDSGSMGNRSQSLKAIKLSNEDPKATTVADGAGGGVLSANGKKLLIRKGNALYIVKANGGKANLNDDSKVQLNGWAFPLTPREEWRQMFTDAWRLERDYFYDKNMHGVDWPAMLKRYEPLVDRVSDRIELADALAQMVSEVSALHIFVYGGDSRSGTDNIQASSLGALLTKAPELGGYRIDRIYRADPDYPSLRSPLDHLDQDIDEGDVITAVNGINALSVRDIGELLRNQAGKHVLLDILEADDDDDEEEEDDDEDLDDDDGDDDLDQYIVRPITSNQLFQLKYHEWEHSRRTTVDDASDGDIGYIHLRAMGSGDIATWTRDYQSAFTKRGLIIDVRHNGGGNIDSWILNRLVREAWFYWQGRAGDPYWNMHGAFRGHMVFLCDENTGSDGEAVTEGFRRLGLGKVIGKRTWGGEIWLSSSNRLVDGGIATAAEIGVYGPEGEWLIEGHGVVPDMDVDNMPHAAWKGEDTQLDTAIKHLQALIADDPRDVPAVPTYPDKSVPDNRKK